MAGPRYDRMIPLVTMIMVGLGIVFVLDAGGTSNALGLPADLPPIGLSWLALAVVAIVAGAGTEIVRRGDTGAGRPLMPASWILPALTPIAVFAFFRLFGSSLAYGVYLVVLLVTGATLMVIYAALYRTLSGDRQAAAFARTRLDLVAFALAFAIFAAVEFTRYRTLYAAALLFPSALLLAYDLLRAQARQAWSIAVVVAVGAVEAYWALSYWLAPFLLNGAALLVIFYAAVGLARTAGEQGITYRSLREYGMLAALSLSALAVASVVLRARLPLLME
jgi:hypothetical protein